MSQDMYGVPGMVYVPLGSGRQYLAAPSTGLITTVLDGDVGQMVQMGCVGKAIALAAGAASAVVSVDTRTGAVVLGHGDVAGLSIASTDVSGLGSAALVATTAFDPAGAATTAQAAAIAACVPNSAPPLLTGQTSTPGVATGTLTNAPTAGDPQTWLQVTINSVMHWIPAWHA